jgi:eukaryotic-like serine/threonine-protein kinase
MEYMDGITLREWIRKKAEQSDGYRKLGLKEAIDLAAQIAEGLEKAHEKGIIHRDVKSENIMVTSDGRAKIMDFGLAKLKGVSKLTKTGSTVGTIAYMSPEQVEGIETDHRTDIFSFGVVIYEMLTGHLPFRAEHETAMMYEIINVEPKSLIDQHKGIEPELNRIVMKCLEKDREERYQSMREVAVDLKRYKRDSEGRRIERKSDASEAAQLSAPPSSGERSKTKWLKIGLAGLGAILLIGLGIYLFTSKPTSIDSIAVLPFVNVGADPNTEYLSDGITRALIDNLAELSNLKVKSQSTVFRYKGKEKDPLEIGKELSVHAVLTGSIELRDQSLIVSVELSDVKEGNHIWGHSYKKTFSDIYLIQEQISKDVSENLRVTMSSVEEQKLAKRSAGNSEAYQLYLKGVYFRFVETDESLDKAASYYQQALEKDPNHVLSYAGLAEAFFLKEFSSIHPDQQKATAAAEKAYALDSTLAETNISLGLIREYHNWNWREAERLLKRAIEINPNHWNAHRELGQLYLRMRRLTEAENELLQSLQLEPRSVHPYVWLGETYWAMGLHLKALDQYKKAAEIDSNFVSDSIGWEYLELGSYEDARKEFEKWKSPFIVCYYAAIGKKEKALAELQKQQQTMKEPNKSSYLSVVYSYLGEKDKTLGCLENIFLINPMLLDGINYYPFYRNLRQEPRFIRLLNKIGLVQ